MRNDYLVPVYLMMDYNERQFNGGIMRENEDEESSGFQIIGKRKRVPQIDLVTYDLMRSSSDEPDISE
jgi:hypothetical protein